MSATHEPTIDQLRDLRDYLVTIPPVLRNEATRFALGKLRVIIGEAANPPPPPESKGLDLEADDKTIRESLDCLQWGHDAAYEALDRITAEVRRLRAGAEGGPQSQKGGVDGEH